MDNKMETVDFRKWDVNNNNNNNNNSAQPTGERNNGEACHSVTHNHKNRTKNSE